MARCTARYQYSNGQQCPNESMPGKSKCKSHGSGGVRTDAGKAAIAKARSKNMGDSRADRIAYQQSAYEMYQLAKLIGIKLIGRPPHSKYTRFKEQ